MSMKIAVSLPSHMHWLSMQTTRFCKVTITEKYDKAISKTSLPVTYYTDCSGLENNAQTSREYQEQ